MAMRLADRLSAARQRQFVGRAPERELFRAALGAEELPFCVLFIFGPGGIGKTTLLNEYILVSQQAGAIPIYIDARNVEPSPEAFTRTLSLAIGIDVSATPFQELANDPRRYVMLIDTYELLTPLDSWLRDVCLPQLPDNVLIVLAGRNPPAAAWRSDPGWQMMLRPVPLRNLSPDESRAYLQKRNIPDEEHQDVLNFTHGHPLALSLVADVFAQRAGVHFRPEAAPDVIKTLLEQFIQKVPGPAHRIALEACALVRLTTESLLAEMLGVSDAHELFSWLRGLSFVESGRLGVFPHDLAREALCADLRWRNPDWFAELHRRARGYYGRSLQQTRGAEQQRILFDYVFLHRENPLVRPFLEWQESGSSPPDRMVAGDRDAILDMVERHEGPESARLAAFWIERQPQSVTVYRDTDRRPIGFLIILPLHLIGPEERLADPATHAAWSYLQRNAPLRPGESAGHFRFWMARDTYQAVSATQSLIFVNIAQYYMNTAGLAFSFFPCAEPQFWEPAFSYMDLNRLHDADFVVDGRHYGVFGHDWRILPPLGWLDLLAERELAEAPLEQRAAVAAPLLVLSEDAFAEAVRDALQHYSHPDTLRDNPLLRSRLVVEGAGATAEPAARVATLQALLQEAAESLRASPREAKAYRALYHTYLRPAATQEQAAELLDLPFSTFRRHLKTGITRVTESLWQRELHGLAI